MTEHSDETPAEVMAGTLADLDALDLVPDSEDEPEKKRLKTSMRLLDKRKGDQERALTILGLRSFIPAEQIHSLLLAVSDRDGDPRRHDERDYAEIRCYPNYGSYPKHRDWSQYGQPDYKFEPFSYPQRQVSVRFYVGYAWKEQEDTYASLDPNLAPDATEDERKTAIAAAQQSYDEWIAQHQSRLARIKDLASDLVQETDCLEADALAFLLANVPFLLPRVRVFREHRRFKPYEPDAFHGYFGYLAPLTIRVSDPTISAVEVFATYRDAQEKLRRKYPTMKPAERDALLIKFYKETPGLTWRKRAEKWNAVGDERPRFEDDGKVMNATYHNAMKKRKKQGGDQR